jgi:alpha-mannosidase
MRPNASGAPAAVGPVELELIEGPVLSEARQAAGAGAWLSGALRLWAGATAVEHEWTVGPVPVHDGAGKEVIVRWTLGGFASATPAPTLFTDSNGLEMQKRVQGAREFPANFSLEPVASNFFPVTTVRLQAGGCDACIEL